MKMMKRTLLLLLLLLVSCSAPQKPETPKVPVPKKEETTPQIKEEVIYPAKERTGAKWPMDFYLSHADSGLGLPSEMAVEDKKILLSWKRKDSGEEVYSCRYEEGYAYCETKGDIPPKEEIIHAFPLPKPGDRLIVTSRKRENIFTHNYILGNYSDFYYEDRGGHDYFLFSWYQESEEGPVLIYEAVAYDEVCTSAKAYREDLWEAFLEDRNLIHTVSLLYEEGKTDYEAEWMRSNRSEHNEKDSLCDCEDYLDLYEGNAELFLDEDDAYDYWMEACE